MNLRANVHNLIFVGGLAVLFFWLVKLLARTRVASVPVVGNVLQFAAQAA